MINVSRGRNVARTYSTPIYPQNAIPEDQLARLGPETRTVAEIDAILEGKSPVGYGEGQVDPRLASSAGVGPRLAGSTPTPPASAVALNNTPVTPNRQQSGSSGRPWKPINPLQDRYDFARGLKVFNIAPDGPPGTGGGSGPRQGGGCENIKGTFIPLPLPGGGTAGTPATPGGLGAAGGVGGGAGAGGAGTGSVLEGGKVDGAGTTNGPGNTGSYNGQNGRLDPGSLTSIGRGHALRADAAAAYNAMVEAARRDGITWSITDSYRTYETQVRLAQEKGLYSQGGLAATPGTSNHGWGLAVDLGGGANNFGTPQNNWLQANAGRFGFRTIPREPWHWEFRG